jgi:hypothetical protein
MVIIRRRRLVKGGGEEEEGHDEIVQDDDNNHHADDNSEGDTRPPSPPQSSTGGGLLVPADALLPVPWTPPSGAAGIASPGLAMPTATGRILLDDVGLCDASIAANTVTRAANMLLFFRLTIYRVAGLTSFDLQRPKSPATKPPTPSPPRPPSGALLPADRYRPAGRDRARADIHRPHHGRQGLRGDHPPKTPGFP